MPATILKLHHKQQGEGPCLIILHGLFGSLDNWQSISRQLAGQFCVYTLDLRNHGKSPHSEYFNYDIMAADLAAFIKHQHVEPVNLIGHSMGGKVVLQLLKEHPQLIRKSMVLDIAPRAYPEVHGQIFKAMLELDLQKCKSRTELDQNLSPEIDDPRVRQFILKNVDRNQNGIFEWKLNLQSIHSNYMHIASAISFEKPLQAEIAFVRGAASSYIKDSDQMAMRETFPNASFFTVENAGHWIHADQPEQLMKIICSYFA